MGTSGPEKINVKFHKNCKNTAKILKISWAKCHFVKFGIYFLGSYKKFSLVLLQITNYIFSPSKIRGHSLAFMKILIVNNSQLQECQPSMQLHMYSTWSWKA